MTSQVVSCGVRVVVGYQVVDSVLMVATVRAL